MWGELPLSASLAGERRDHSLELAMNIREILQEKGAHVISMWPEHTVADALKRCDELNISSIVITDHSGTPIGLVSDRDTLRALARHGTRAMALRVTDIMQSPAPQCRSDASTNEIMRRMTVERIRHVVVTENARMIGIVSIGDLVKAKLRDADLESRVLRERALSRLAAE